jgi:transcriptional regulator with XRE-family HTH domain
LRKEHGYSLARLAGLVFVSDDLIHKVEVASRRPSRDLAGELDKVLGADGTLLEHWQEFAAENRAHEVSALICTCGSSDACSPSDDGQNRSSSRRERGIVVPGSDIAPSRSCAGCGRPLSRYNTGQYCQACHREDEMDKTPGLPDATARPGSLGARLRELREQRRMTQTVLADFSGLSTSFLSMVERGQRPLNRYTDIIALASALRVPPTELAPGLPAERVEPGPGTLRQRKTAGPQRPSDYLPADVLARPELVIACAARDLGAIFTIANKWGGAGFTVSHIARRCEMTIGQVQAYIKHGRKANSVGVFERTSDGLRIPSNMLGIGRRAWESEESADTGEGSDRKAVAMPYAKTSLRKEKQELRERTRSTGLGYRQIAAEFTRAYRLRPRSAWREAYGWSLAEAADRINAYRGNTGLDPGGFSGMTGAHLCEHENWPGHGDQPAGRKPGPYLLAVLAEVYGCHVTELIDFADRAHLPPADLLVLDTYTTERSPSAAQAPASQVIAVRQQESIMPGRQDKVEMERRELLQSLAALGVASTPAMGALESIRRSFGSAFAQSDRDHLDDWENAVAEYGYSYFTTSPTALIPDLAADIVAVRSIAASFPADSPGYRGWCRIGGAISGLMAKSLSNLGNARESRQWWNMAEHVADASGDIELSLWVRGERIIHGLYERRPAQAVLRQVDSAVEFARGHNNCVGMAHVSTARAQALVLSGDYRSAEYELGRAGDIVALLPPSATRDSNSVMCWGEDRLHYTQAWVYSHMGNADKTAQAAERALRLYPASDDRTPAQIKLMLAFALIRSGSVDEGIRHAHAVYGPLSPDQRTTMLGTLAGQVLSSIPAESQNRPDVAAYRTLVASPISKAIES